VKVTFFISTTRGHMGSGGISPRIVDLGTRRRWSPSFMSHRLYSRT